MGALRFNPVPCIKYLLSPNQVFDTWLHHRSRGHLSIRDFKPRHQVRQNVAIALAEAQMGKRFWWMGSGKAAQRQR